MKLGRTYAACMQHQSKADNECGYCLKLGKIQMNRTLFSSLSLLTFCNIISNKSKTFQAIRYRFHPLTQIYEALSRESETKRHRCTVRIALLIFCIAI